MIDYQAWTFLAMQLHKKRFVIFFESEYYQTTEVAHPPFRLRFYCLARICGSTEKRARSNIEMKSWLAGCMENGLFHITIAQKKKSLHHVPNQSNFKMVYIAEKNQDFLQFAFWSNCPVLSISRRSVACSCSSFPLSQVDFRQTTCRRG